MSISAARFTVSAVAILLAAGGLQSGSGEAGQTNVVAAGATSASSLRESLEPIRKLIGDRKYDEAEQLAREQLARAQSEFGPDSLEVAEVMSVLVDALRQGPKKKDPETLELAERIAKVRDTTLGPESLGVADAMALLGGVHSVRGEADEALAAYERALAIKETIHGPEAPEVAKALLDLRDPLEDLENVVRLRALAERVVAIFDKTSWPEDLGLLDRLDNLGLLLTELGYYEDARPLLENVLAMRERRLGPNDLWVAASLMNVAILHGDSGDSPEETCPLFERSVRIWELGNPNSTWLARTLADLAECYQWGGDYVRPKPLLERALAIYELTKGPESWEYAWVLSSLAALGHALGDSGRAEEMYKRAIAIWDNIPGSDPDKDSALQGLGILYTGMGRFEDARKHLERTLAIQEKALGSDHKRVALTLVRLAELQMRTGDYDGARSRCERATSIYEKVYGPDHGGVAWGLVCLADVLAETGQLAEARPLYERGITLLEKTRGSENVFVGGFQLKLSRLLLQTGDTHAALTAGLRAESIGREHLRLTARSLPERSGLQYASVRTSGLGLALSAATSAPAPGGVASVLDAVIRSRAVVLDEMAERHRAAAVVADPELARLESEFAAARRKLAALVVRGVDERNPELSRQRVDRARETAELAERALAEKSASFRREQARSAAGLDQVISALPAKSALVSFVRYDRQETTSPFKGVSSVRAVPSYVAFVSRAGMPPALVPLRDAPEIDALVARLQEAGAAPVTAEGRAAVQLEAAYRLTGAALREKIWDPIAPQVALAERVFIVPDGGLNLVNLGALPLGKTVYVMEKGPLLHYLSAERDLVDAEAGPRGEGLLALGDPAFDEEKAFAESSGEKPATEGEAPTAIASAHPFRGVRSSCGDFRSLRFERLPGASREVEEVAKTWAKTVGSRGVTRLQGAAATEAAFKVSAPHRRVIHVASHGFFVGGSCASMVAAAEGARPDDPDPAIIGDNPLLLSGLAFAGANNREKAGADDEDGILTAEEIAALDLSGVQWAVLSGCDTGVGEVRAGEGIFGLRRAFQVAGVRTVIMSLWPVEDESVRAWMKSLYDHRFRKNLDTAESVRRASLDVLRQRRARKLSTHPFYWAGFVAAGGLN